MRHPFRSPKRTPSISRNLFAVALACLSTTLTAPSAPAAPRNLIAADTPDAGVSMTIEGLVRDVACPMQNHHSTATHFNLKCAQACIQNGSPLILLTKTDEIYFPMTGQMPDRSTREQLIPYVGKFVRVTGTVYRRNGTRTIVIRNISELRDVKLDSNLGDD